MSVTINDQMARIAISKNLIKEYKGSDSERTVYLKNGTEFQIYLKNPYQSHLGIKIYVNNKFIGNTLVLKPGQSCWLERYLNENSKFLFSTYEVENTAEMKYAINQNGRVKIEFYHEVERYTNYAKPLDFDIDTLYGSTIASNPLPLDVKYNSSYTSFGSLTGSLSDVVLTSGCTFSANNNVANALNDMPPKERRKSVATNTIRTEIDSTIETGRIEKGSASDQEFNTCDISFDYRPFRTENILILPVSRKQVNVEETRRRYCSQCGKKVSPKDKFCSNCGARLN